MDNLPTIKKIKSNPSLSSSSSTPYFLFLFFSQKWIANFFIYFFLKNLLLILFVFLFKWTMNHGAKFNFYLNQSLFFFINKKNFVENQCDEKLSFFQHDGKLSLIWDGRKSKWLYNKTNNPTQRMTKMTYVIIYNPTTRVI